MGRTRHNYWVTMRDSSGKTYTGVREPLNKWSAAVVSDFEKKMLIPHVE